MPRMEMHVRLTGDGEQVLLQLEMDGTPLGHIIFDGPTSERHINLVALARSQIKEQVSPDLDPGARLESIPDPVWKALAVPEHKSAALVLRHPGLGWLSFLHPPKEARAMGKALLEIADALEAKGEPGSS